MTNQEIYELMARFDASGLQRLKLSRGDVQIELEKAAPAAAAAVPAPAAPAAPPEPCGPDKELCLDKRVLTERDVIAADKDEVTCIHIGEKTILTALAVEYAKSKGIRLIRGAGR